MTGNRRSFLAAASVGSISVCHTAWAQTPKGNAAQQIPLESIYSTNGQKGLKAVPRGLKEPYGYELEELRRHSQLMGASNVFLVRGDDITAAVKGTRRVFAGGGPADVPLDPDEGSKPTSFWLVAYLGTDGSSPTAWLVQSAARIDQTVRLTYVRPTGLGGTKDVHLYFVWVPLGKLEAQIYCLELFDAQKKHVSLLRRVTVLER